MKPNLISLSFYVLFILLNLVISTQGAIIMKEDGISMNCSIDGEQLIMVKTSSEETKLKLKDIGWIAGKERKRIRLLSNLELIAGVIDKSEIKVKRGDEIISIPLKNIIFFYNGDIDLERIGKIEIIEYKEGTTLTEYLKTENGKELKVTLLPQNWDGGIDISAPLYVNEISSRSDLIIDFFIRGDDHLYMDIAEVAAFLRAGVFFKYIGEKDGVGSVLHQGSLTIKGAPPLDLKTNMKIINT